MEQNTCKDYNNVKFNNYFTEKKKSFLKFICSKIYLNVSYSIIKKVMGWNMKFLDTDSLYKSNFCLL